MHAGCTVSVFMLNRIEAHTAYIDAVCHLRQDYARFFTRKLNNTER